MKEYTFDFDFEPTMSELKAGNKAVVGVIYSGWWRLLRILVGLTLAFGFIVAGMVIFLLALKPFSLEISDLGPAGGILFPATGLLLYVPCLLQNNRLFQFLISSRAGHNSRFRVDDEGVEYHFGGCKVTSGWGAVERVVLSRKVLTLVISNQYFPVPVRCFSSREDARKAAELMERWRLKKKLS